MIFHIFKNIEQRFSSNIIETTDKSFQAILNNFVPKSTFTDLKPIAISTDNLLAKDFPDGLRQFIEKFDELELFKTDYIPQQSQLWIGLSLKGLYTNVQDIDNPYLKEIVRKLQKQYASFDENGILPQRFEKPVWHTQKQLADTLKMNGFATLKHHHYLYKIFEEDLNAELSDNDTDTLVHGMIITSFNDLGDIEMIAVDTTDEEEEKHD